MSIETVKNYFKKFGRENDIMEFDVSSATVELAAKAVGVEPARITKTLAFKKDDGCILIAMAGDTKVDKNAYAGRNSCSYWPCCRRSVPVCRSGNSRLLHRYISSKI